MKSEQRNIGLLCRTLLAATVSFALFVLLLLLPAGTFDYWQAWCYLGICAIYLFPGTIFWWWIDPDYLARRLRVGAGAEQDRNQKIIMRTLAVYACGWLTIPGFDQRFGWSHVPFGVSVVAFMFIILGVLIVYWTALCNHYSAATITVEENQPVVSTGPYAWVRHPMYGGVLLWSTAMPLALDSWWGLVATPPLYVLLYFRILGEELYLQENLPGYDEYCRKVRWRLIPFVF